MSDKPIPGRRRTQGGRRIANPKQNSDAATPGTDASSSRSANRTRSASRTSSRNTTPEANGAGSQGTSRTASTSTAKGAGTAAGAKTAKNTRTSKGAGAGTATAARSSHKKNLLNYPRAGKTGFWRWIPSIRLLVIACALCVLAGVGFGVWLYNDTEIPEANDVALAQTSRVYFSDGKTVMGEFSDINRTILPEDEIPQSVKDAVVASEDSTFYENRGVSPKGIMRALVNNMQGGARQGGSTITQQYVENYYTGTVTSYSGKAREVIMALKADQTLSKDEILARYLNTIYFGRSAYGIQAASQAYFGKDAKDLTKEEAAVLVAIIPAPTAYDPAVNPKHAKQLWSRVISRQVNETKTLTKSEADAMKFPKVIEHKRKNKFGGTNGYLLSTVKNELIAQGMTADEVDTGGYTIVSTIDPKVQKNTLEAIKKMPKDRPAENRVGTLTMDSKTGAVVAMYGGPDFVKQARNDATQSRMQAGSIFKAFTLVAAVDDGYSLRSVWDGDSPKRFAGWTVKNFSNRSYGQVDLMKSTENSINTSYAALNLDMGPKKTRDAAIKLGLSEKTPGLDDQATNVLGTASPTVREMATAYGTLASGGVRHDPYVVQKVTNADGSIKYEHKDNSKRVIEKDVAGNATVALQGPPSRGGSARAVAQKMGGRPVAGKTGTSEKFRSAWFVGYTPQYVTAVGMFQPSKDGKVEQELTPFGGVENITGGSIPTDVWIDIMQPTHEGLDKLDFPGAVTIKRDNKASKQPKPTETPSPTPSEEPTKEEPTTEAPSPTPTPSPTPSEKPSSTPEKTTEPSSTPEKTTEPTEKPTKPKDKPGIFDRRDKARNRTGRAARR